MPSKIKSNLESGAVHHGSSHLRIGQFDSFIPDPKRLSEHFTRANLIAFAKTMAWVVPLTILIWVYAEREQIAVEPGRVIPIEVRTTAPNRIVTLIAADKNIVADLSGPRGQLEQVLSIISRPTENDRVWIDVDARLPPGNHQISTLGIANGPLFVKIGRASCRERVEM